MTPVSANNPLLTKLYNNFSNEKSQVLMEQLSSGKRITSASVDAAGLQISNRLTTQNMVKRQHMRNMNDGISYGQTADAALSEVTNALQRMRKLAIQSANGSNTPTDRAALDEEFQQLKATIDEIAFNTEIFGKYPLLDSDPYEQLGNAPLLNETFSNGFTETFASGYVTLGVIPPGSTNIDIFIDDNGANDNIQIFDMNGNHLVGTDLSGDAANVESQLFTNANGFTGTETYSNANLFDGNGYNFPATESQTIGGSTFTFSGDGNALGNLNESLQVDKVDEPLLLAVTGSGVFDATVSWGTLGSLSRGSKYDDDGPMMVTARDLAVGKDGYIWFDEFETTASSLGISGVDVTDQDSAQKAITALDNSIEVVSKHRADVGAKVNAVESVYRNTLNQTINLDEAKSRIADTDYAETMAKKVQEDILQNSSRAVASQASNAHEETLSVLLEAVRES